MLPLTRLLGWIGLAFGVAAASVLVAAAAVRWRLLARIRAELGRDKVLLVSSTRLGALGEREGAPGLRHAGILALLQGGLYYHSWLGRKELFVPGPAITYIGIGAPGNGRSRERNAGSPSGRPGTRRPSGVPAWVVLRFLNTKGKEDGVIIRILSAEQWVSAIKTHLIARA